MYKHSEIYLSRDHRDEAIATLCVLGQPAANEMTTTYTREGTNGDGMKFGTSWPEHVITRGVGDLVA